MIEIGVTQKLIMVKSTDFGIYLSENGSPDEERVLLPKSYVPADMKEGDALSVFVYRDSKDIPIATTLTPALELHRTAQLIVREVTTIGCFLDWGLPKDLLLPFREQTYRPQANDKVLVALYLDKSNRLCATMRVYPYLRTSSPYRVGDMVDGLVYEQIESFGTFVAVDYKYSALIPKSEPCHQLIIGQEVRARITAVHEDGKLTLTLRDTTSRQMDSDAEHIIQLVTQAGGFLPYHDKSDPQSIIAYFGISKNAFKRAIGRLMKSGKLTITENGIRLVK